MDKLVEFVKRLDEEALTSDEMGDAVGERKTLVYMTNKFYEYHWTLFEILEKFQQNKVWDLVIFGDYSKKLKMPLHRLIYFYDLKSTTEHYLNLRLNDLMDVIKEPDFDRYEFTYRMVESRNDLFNETCMGGIDYVNIKVAFPSEQYLPIFIALLRKVNIRRMKKKLSLNDKPCCSKTLSTDV